MAPFEVRWDGPVLKLTVPDAEQRSAVAALGMDPLDAQIRQVYCFDTPDLALNKHGLVVSRNLKATTHASR